MRYTIAINSYKHPEVLARCLRSVKEAISDLDAEILVADSETQEETEVLMREEFPDVRFFPHKKNVGMGALANAGLRNAKGDFVFLLNYDTTINRDVVEKLGKYLENHNDVGLVAPKVLNFDGSLQYTCFRFYTPITIVYHRTPFGKLSFAQKHLDRFAMKECDHNTVLEPDWIMGSAIMVRREEVLEMGGFDPRFFMYFEDTDLCRRYWERGKRVVYLPEVTLYHLHGKGSARGGVWRALLFNKLTRIHIASAYKYFWKYRGKANPRYGKNQ
jgi:GT2 family glycosyltransferase